MNPSALSALIRLGTFTAKPSSSYRVHSILQMTPPTSPCSTFSGHTEPACQCAETIYTAIHGIFKVHTHMAERQMISARKSTPTQDFKFSSVIRSCMQVHIPSPSPPPIPHTHTHTPKFYTSVCIYFCECKPENWRGLGTGVVLLLLYYF